jgi:hypothetical protein
VVRPEAIHAGREGRHPEAAFAGEGADLDVDGLLPLAKGIRPGTPLSLDNARRLVQGYVTHYNNVRLNSATGYITPTDMLAGRQQGIHAERDRSWRRTQRQIRRQQAA